MVVAKMAPQITPPSPPLRRLGHVMAVTSYLRHIGAPVDRYRAAVSGSDHGNRLICLDSDLEIELTGDLCAANF